MKTEDLRDAADTAVERIVNDLNNRSGMGIDHLDRETQREIRKTWAMIIRRATA